jgi:hypothetical protein
MLMTEAEAKTKWCPMARVDDGGRCSVNRLGPMNASIGEPIDDPAANCLGSRCMVWCNGHAAGKGYCGLAGI